MEVLSIALFIAIMILIVSLKKSLQHRLVSLETEVRTLREGLGIPVAEITVPPTVPMVTTTPPELITPEVKETWKSGFEEVEGKPLSVALESLLQDSATETFLADPGHQQKGATSVNFSEPGKSGQQPSAITPGRSFMERNPDLEKFIGENLVSKIGIGILVLAIGFFVKYAIDNDWIGPVGRVGIGILCGGVLAAIAHRLRNNYKAFSSVLTGGGLAIFYFTIALAYHQFQLFSQVVAFIMMVIITGFAVVLSQLYNRQELAIIALVGGFATPFMVSSGNGNYQTLFAYLIVLNAGLLFIAYNKAWRLLNLLAFVFTVILFGSWLVTLKTNVASSTYRNGLLFATVFYLLFFFINIAHNIRENKKFIASDFGILLANTSLYFAAGIYCLTTMKAVEYRGLFTASVGVFNLAASLLLIRNRKIDNNILYLLIGITLSFISLTAPIQLNGNNITLFWATESVLLYWLYQKSKIHIIRLTSFLVWAAMLVSLAMDWLNIYGENNTPVPIIFNKGFVTSVFSAIASYLLFVLRKKDNVEIASNKMSLAGINLFRAAGILLLFAAGALEINHQFHFYYPGSALHVPNLLLYSFAFVLSFHFITSRVKSLRSHWHIQTILLIFCIVIYLLTIPILFAVQRQILQQNSPGYRFITHWVSALLMAIILYQFISVLRANAPAVKKYSNFLIWSICISIIIFLSAEVQLLVNSLFYVNNNSLAYIQRIYVKTGLPILWGLCSFGFMWLGMKHKFRTLRIISLSLFFVILLKLFLFDIRNIPVAGKIAAFFSLGVLLLVVSFMYQRLKRIIIEDEKKPAI
ncbi:MAG: DUF2339 domain-containing protein [Chitinophagaceae bacterium]